VALSSMCLQWFGCLSLLIMLLGVVLYSAATASWSWVCPSQQQSCCTTRPRVYWAEVMLWFVRKRGAGWGDPWWRLGSRVREVKMIH